MDGNVKGIAVMFNNGIGAGWPGNRQDIETAIKRLQPVPATKPNGHAGDSRLFFPVNGSRGNHRIGPGSGTHLDENKRGAIQRHDVEFAHGTGGVAGDDGPAKPPEAPLGVALGPVPPPSAPPGAARVDGAGRLARHGASEALSLW